MRKLSLAAVFLATALAAMPHSAHAQIGYIVEGSYTSDIPGAGAKAAGAVGAGLRFPLGTWTQKSGMVGMFTFDWFFPDDHTVGTASYRQQYWEVNMNGVIDVKSLKVVYVGTGLVYSDQAVSTNANVPDLLGSGLGINVLAGLRLGSKRNGVFVQGRYELGAGKIFVASGGFYF
jgi:hypothetical protein